MSSLVLAADDPAALASFYGALLEVEPLPGLSSTNCGGCPGRPVGAWSSMPHQGAGPKPRQQGRLALCLQRPSAGAAPMERLKDWINEALGLCAAVLDPPRLEAFGAEAWLMDPEGNRLLLLVH